MIDIHSHIINNVDDGAKNLDMALNMLRKSEEIGIKGIVATPHYLRGIYNFEYSEIEECAEQLRIEAKKNNINIEIYTGQEVYYTEKIVEYFTDGIIGTINKSRYMLIEFPMRDFDIDAILNDIYELQIRGIVPIIAHPERYKVFLKKPSLINNFIEEGFLFQVNAGSLTGYFGKDVKKTATKYLENSLVKNAEKDENGKYVLSYVEVPIMCKVSENAKTSENITNIADITECKDENKNNVTDRDSQPGNVKLPSDSDLPGYKDNEKGDYVPGQQDDDDFEKVIVKTFDLALRKWVTQAIVTDKNGTTITETGHQPYDDPEEIVKVDLHRKHINDVTVKFRYSIRVINEGEIAGYAKEVTDYVPQGLKFVAEDNQGWIDEGNNVISTKMLENTLLQPGDYKDVEVVLTWINSQDNMGVMINTAEISQDYNEYDIPDKDSTPDNQKPGEDDIDDAPVMLSISTGQMRIYFTLGFIVLITIAGGVVIIKKYVL